MLRTFVPIVILAAVTGGCASYNPSSAILAPPEEFAAYHADSGVAAGALPLVDVEEQKKVFDADLTSKGVLAIQVVTENRSAPPVVVRRSDMMLRLPDGSLLSPVSANTTVAKLGEDGSVVGATIAFGLIGFLAAANAEENARASRLADYRSKEFSDTTLAKENSAHGFVFFIPPPGTDAITEATLAVRFVNAEDASSWTIDLPLVDLIFEKVPTQSEKTGKTSCC